MTKRIKLAQRLLASARSSAQAIHEDALARERRHRDEARAAKAEADAAVADVEKLHAAESALQD